MKIFNISIAVILVNFMVGSCDVYINTTFPYCIITGIILISVIWFVIGGLSWITFLIFNPKKAIAKWKYLSLKREQRQYN